MLRLIVKGGELFDENTSTFTEIPDTEIELEHSLLSLSKWESKFQKPFLSSNDKTTSEIMSYIKFMCLDDKINDEVFLKLSKDNIDAINEYINSPQSATTFGSMPQGRGRGEVITSELIYYWLVAFTIPFECETWHLNRLFSLIRICNIKNSKPQKINRQDLAARNRQLNEQRKAQLNTSG